MKIQPFSKELLFALPGLAYWKDLRGVYRGCNQAMAEAAGLISPDDMIGKTDADLPWREQEFLLRAHDQATITNKIEETTEENRTLVDGRIVTCLTARKPITDEEGEVIGLLGTCLEINKAKQKKERVHEEPDKLHEMVSQLWDENAARWCEVSSKGLDLWRDHLNTPAFLNMLPDVSHQSGLDVGCGEGHNSRLIAKRCQSLTAIDLSEEFLKYHLANPAPPNLTFQRANAADLPFPSESFDFVVATLSLMDMPQLERVLSEVERVLTPTGFLQFSIIHPAFNEHFGQWVKDEKGEVLGFLMKDYFTESRGEVHEWQPPRSPAGRKPFKVPRFSKPLSRWFNALVQAGFVLEEVREPFVDEQRIKAYPELASTRGVAHSLMIRVRKKGALSEPLRRILEKLPGNIWWKDEHLKYLGCNDRVIKVLGLNSRRDFIGKTDHQLWEKEIADRLLEADLCGY